MYRYYFIVLWLKKQAKNITRVHYRTKMPPSQVHGVHQSCALLTAYNGRMNLGITQILNGQF